MATVWILPWLALSQDRIRLDSVSLVRRSRSARVISTLGS